MPASSYPAMLCCVHCVNILSVSFLTRDVILPCVEKPHQISRFLHQCLLLCTVLRRYGHALAAEC